MLFRSEGEGQGEGATDEQELRRRQRSSRPYVSSPPRSSTPSPSPHTSRSPPHLFLRTHRLSSLPFLQLRRKREPAYLDVQRKRSSSSAIPPATPSDRRPLRRASPSSNSPISPKSKRLDPDSFDSPSFPSPRFEPLSPLPSVKHPPSSPFNRPSELFDCSVQWKRRGVPRREQRHPDPSPLLRLPHLQFPPTRLHRRAFQISTSPYCWISGLKFWSRRSGREEGQKEEQIGRAHV